MAQQQQRGQQAQQQNEDIEEDNLGPQLVARLEVSWIF